MTQTRKLLAVMAAATSLALTGCVTLLPEAKPVQLYRFTPEPEAVDRHVGDTPRIPVIRAGGGFQTAAAGDRILTSQGNEAAYLANARWTQAAAVLFDQAVMAGFAASNGPARLVTPGEIGRPAFGMRIDVSRFEADYSADPEAAPEVHVDIYVVITRLKDQKVVAEQSFSIRRKAAGNRGAAIAGAFQSAVQEAVGKLVAIADQGVAAQASAS